MPKYQKVPYYDFRKRINNTFALTQLQILSDEYALNISELCWKFISERIVAEKNKRDKKVEAIEEIKNYRN